AEGVLGSFELAPGERLALLRSNAFSTGAAALAVWDAQCLLHGMDAAGALSLDGFGANLAVLDEAGTRAHPGIQRSADRLRTLLEGSRLLEPGAPATCPDPLPSPTLP